MEDHQQGIIISTVIGTAVTLGVVHVLTGPDHLSALATLSASIGNGKAFVLGILWGCGHSTGLVLVATILIAISSNNNNTTTTASDDDDNNSTVPVPAIVTTIFESLVGVFMLLLGTYGIIRACRNKHDYSSSSLDHHHHHHHHHHHVIGEEEEELPSTSFRDEIIFKDQKDETSKKKDTQYRDNKDDEEEYDDDDDDFVMMEKPTIRESLEMETSDMNNNNNNNNDSCCCCCYCCHGFFEKLSKTILSFGIGIIHGLAGPGGVLGVIPAVQLHNWKFATIYLGCFCFSSTLTMGCFAAFYGTCSACLAAGQQSSTTTTTTTRRQYKIELFSASLSLLVGFLWLILLSLGKLEDVFP